MEMIIKGCKHTQQQVRKDKGLMVQKCLECRAITAKWVERTGKMVYEIGEIR